MRKCGSSVITPLARFQGHKGRAGLRAAKQGLLVGHQAHQNVTSKHSPCEHTRAALWAATGRQQESDVAIPLHGSRGMARGMSKVSSSDMQ
eukprot:scaffold106081_cov17-Tisochrysis_lutea.AAC.1